MVLALCRSLPLSAADLPRCHLRGVIASVSSRPTVDNGGPGKSALLMHVIKTINGGDSLMEFSTTAGPDFCGRAQLLRHPV